MQQKVLFLWRVLIYNLNTYTVYSIYSQIRGYGAFSVSASQLEKVKAYIKDQDEHHRRLSFKEEYEAFLRRYGFKTSVNR